MTKFRADIEKVITVNTDSKEGKEINDKLLARYEKVRIAAEIFGNQSLTVSVLLYKLRSIIEDLFNIKKVMTFDYKEDEDGIEKLFMVILNVDSELYKVYKLDTIIKEDGEHKYVDHFILDDDVNFTKEEFEYLYNNMEIIDRIYNYYLHNDKDQEIIRMYEKYIKIKTRNIKFSDDSDLNVMFNKINNFNEEILNEQENINGYRNYKEDMDKLLNDHCEYLKGINKEEGEE